MTARFARDQMSFVMPDSFSDASGAVRRPGLAARLAAGVQWLVDMPRRRAIMAELSALSDHELDDIGLTRAELPRVFERQLAASRAQVG